MFSFQNLIKQIVFGNLNRSACCLFKLCTSYLFVLYAILTLVVQPGEQHYEPGLDVCILAAICNHTNNPECGKERNDLDKRMFLDECDMIEYNCDNRKDYFIIPHEECDSDYTKETKKDLSTKELHTVSIDQHSDIITTNGLKSESSIISTLSIPSTTNNEKPKKTIVTLTNTPNLTTTIKMSSEHKHSNAGVCTCGDKNKQILTTAIQKTTSTTESTTTTEHISTTKTETITDKTTHITTPSLQDKTTQKDKTTQQDKTTQPDKTTQQHKTIQQDKTTRSPQINTVTRNCTRQTTIPISSIPRKPHTSMLTILLSAKTTVNNINVSSTLITDTTTSSSPRSTVTNRTSEITEKNNATERTSTTELTSKDEISTTHLTSKITAAPKNTSKKTKPTTKLTSKDAGKTSPCGTKDYPKDCNRPFTWETTAKGETRDFYQILRARYGDRLKTLKGTTHWPRRRNYYHGKYNFYASRHNEG